MNYREIKQDGFLSHFVQCFWEYETIDSDQNHTILPDGYFDLIAIFEHTILKTVVLTGVWTKPTNIFIPESTKYFAIRFKLLAAEYLFRDEIKSILDATKPLPHAFWGINKYESNEFDKFVSDISNSLEHAVKHLKEIDIRKLKLFEHIYQNKPAFVSELSENAVWSSRQINRYFNHQFGFPLKEFLRMVRCRKSYSDIAKGELFPQDDYFDQPHFIKEVKKYTGATPTELYKNKDDRFLQLSTIRHE